MNLVRGRRALTHSIALILSAPALVFAADWTGAVSSDWNTPGNWSGGVVPSGENAYIGISGGLTAPFTATITADVPLLVDLQVARGGGPAILNHSAGSASTGNENWLDVGTSGGTGTYNLGNVATTGGTLTGIGLGSGSIFVGNNNGNGGRLYVGGVDFSNAGGNGTFKVNTSGLVKIDNDLTIGTGNGTGLMLVDAGTITTGGWNFIGKPDNGAGATNGTLKMSGGSLTNTGGRTYMGLGNSTGRLELSGTGTYNNPGDWFAVGQENLTNPTPASISMTGGGTLNANLFSVGGSPDNSGKGTITVTGNAVLNVDGEFWVGNKVGSEGTMTVTGGTVNAGNWFAVGRDGGKGTLTISGGVVQKTDADGALEITNATSTTANGTVNLDGGILAVNSITGSGGTGSVANLFLNGGTLKPTVANGDFIGGNVNPQVKNGGAVIDTNNFDISINKALVPDVGSTGGLTKNGNGTLNLGGTSTYGGATTVNRGTLRLSVGSASGSLAGDGPIIVNNGGTVASSSVDGTGYFNHTATNGITLNQGGTLMVLEGGRLSMDRTINSIGGTIASTGVTFDNGQSYAFRFEGEAGETNSYNFTSSVGGVPSLVSATNVGVDNVTFNVTRGAGTTDLNVTGNVVNSFGSGGLTKAGNGIMVLANANNAYTGPTKVIGGKLLVDGSIATSSLTSVSAGGTLGGIGTVGALKLQGGNLAPGDSAGILNAGDTEFAGGAFTLELNGTGTAGVNYDQLNIVGAFSLTASTQLVLTLGFVPVQGSTFTILANDGVDTNSLGALFTYAGNPVYNNSDFGHFGSLAYRLNYNGGTNANDMVLTVVPEPTAAVSVIGGMCVLLGVGRRRRRN